MALSTPADREFRVLPAGYVRDKIVLANFRQGLRNLPNPETGQLCTEEEIARATRSPGRWFVGAQAIDDYAQGEQRNALYLADQVRLERASGKWLTDFHGALWLNEGFLPPSGGAGPVRVTGTPGTIVVGSTTVPDDGAHKARDPNGNLYQVFETEDLDASGNATVTLVAISTGATTNPTAGTVLTWTQTAPGINPTVIVDEDFTGGTDQETEAEYADRIAGVVRYRPGAGNDSQQRMWARQSSNAVEDAFIYPCALRSGSVIAAVTQKRKKALGPLGRIASASTRAAAIAYLTPPTSPVVPTRTFEIVTTCVPDPTDLTMRLGMQRASKTGWTDAQPFPAFSASTPIVASVIGTTQLTLICPADATLPGQAALATLTAPNVPAIMIWNPAKSAWELLKIASIVDTGSNHYTVNLVAAPSFTVLPGCFVSPATPLASIIAQAITEYFDELGPGDFFDVTTDPRGQRCVRFPANVDLWPTQAGADIVTDVLAALGGTTANGQLASISKTVPSFQPSLQNGPFMLTPGNVGIYSV
jgi:hypothetical protein